MSDRSEEQLETRELELLRAREERYSALVENSPYCIHEIDLDGELISMNPAGLRMMAAEAECDVVGMPYLDAVCAEDRPRIENLLRAATYGEFSEFEFTAVNGRIFRSNFVPLGIRDGRPTRLMGITQDVTKRRELERQLRQSQQLDAIGRLAGGVAHDFNNLLTVILGSTEMLEMQVDGEARADVAAIGNAAQRAAELTSQLLTFARRQTDAPTVVDVRARIRQGRELLSRLLPENVRIELSLSDEALSVRIDPGRFDQVLVNLATNARDAMPDGGTLRIDADRIQLGRRAADAHASLEPGPHVRVRVVDSGCGMPPEVLERVFEPFYSTKGPSEGTGLGLATSHGIVTQAGGTVDVQSTPGGGTTFVILLPSVDACPAEEAPASPVSAMAGSACVLLVEDDGAVREATRRMLADQGCEVLVATDAEQALELEAAHGGRIDLLLTDVVLPGMNGRELAEILAQRRPSTRVLFTSGYNEDAVVGWQARGDDITFLPKPYTPSALRETVASILRT
ncbi:MAG: ATP-binding protein [Planctomycetota bacterium]|nr:ATP-binding protein [Planctomycetota bacterium]